jgi:hypothetical protein
MNKLLKEAIADAKAVRETAMANAKIALEETFRPRLQSILSARLAEEAEEEGYDEDEEAPTPTPEPMDEEEYMKDGEDGTPADNISEDDMMNGGYDEDEGNLDLEAIIRELEGGDGMYDEDEEAPAAPAAPAPAPEEEPADAEMDLEEIIRALSEVDGDETDEDGETMNEDDDNEETDEDEAPAASTEELQEAYRVIKFMQSKLNEVNLLNAKLLFSNKLFRNYELNESQKMKVIENFDRANNLREVKLVYSTICESLTSKKAKKQIKESYASKPTRSTAPKKEILSEGNQLAARWKKLANLK